MIINMQKKYHLQYIKLGLPTNVNNIQVGHVLRTEKFESLKEVNCVIKKLTRSKGFDNHGNILLNKEKQIKINIQIT